jgi:hypothetical protein
MLSVGVPTNRKTSRLLFNAKDAPAAIFTTSPASIVNVAAAFGNIPTLPNTCSGYPLRLHVLVPRLACPTCVTTSSPFPSNVFANPGYVFEKKYGAFP